MLFLFVCHLRVFLMQRLILSFTSVRYDTSDES
jgi:hypothetical protein